MNFKKHEKFFSGENMDNLVILTSFMKDVLRDLKLFIGKKCYDLVTAEYIKKKKINTVDIAEIYAKDEMLGLDKKSAIYSAYEFMTVCCIWGDINIAYEDLDYYYHLFKEYMHIQQTAYELEIR